MAKKDLTISENIDRGGQEDTPLPVEKNQTVYTEVKNANASGMGSMGRNADEPTSIEVKKEE